MCEMTPEQLKIANANGRERWLSDCEAIRARVSQTFATCDAYAPSTIATETYAPAPRNTTNEKGN